MSPLLSHPRTIVLASAVGLCMLIGLGWLALASIWPEPPSAHPVKTVGYAVPEAPERLPEPAPPAVTASVSEARPDSLSDQDQEQDPSAEALQTLFETARSQFAPDAAELSQASRPYLLQAVELANARGEAFHVEIFEPDGDLARRRAEALFDALRENGLISGRILMTGMTGDPGVGVYLAS